MISILVVVLAAVFESVVQVYDVVCTSFVNVGERRATQNKT